jgi:hypothetical protein
VPDHAISPAIRDESVCRKSCPGAKTARIGV